MTEPKAPDEQFWDYLKIEWEGSATIGLMDAIRQVCTKYNYAEPSYETAKKRKNRGHWEKKYDLKKINSKAVHLADAKVLKNIKKAPKGATFGEAIQGQDATYKNVPGDTKGDNFGDKSDNSKGQENAPKRGRGRPPKAEAAAHNNERITAARGRMEADYARAVAGLPDSNTPQGFARWRGAVPDEGHTEEQMVELRALVLTRHRQVWPVIEEKTAKALAMIEDAAERAEAIFNLVINADLLEAADFEAHIERNKHKLNMLRNIMTLGERLLSGTMKASMIMAGSQISDRKAWGLDVGDGEKEDTPLTPEAEKAMDDKYAALERQAEEQMEKAKERAARLALEFADGSTAAKK